MSCDVRTLWKQDVPVFRFFFGFLKNNNSRKVRASEFASNGNAHALATFNAKLDKSVRFVRIHYALLYTSNIKPVV